jgi:hypothetical protein
MGEPQDAPENVQKLKVTLVDSLESTLGEKGHIYVAYHRPDSMEMVSRCPAARQMS